MNHNPSSSCLYDEYLTPDEICDHAAIHLNDLSSEVWLLKAMAGRYLGWLKAMSPSGEIKINDSVLRNLARVFGGIASVLATHLKLNSPISEYEDDIEEGLDMARVKLGILTPQEFEALGYSTPPMCPTQTTNL